MIRYFKLWVTLLGILLAVAVIGFARSLYVRSCYYGTNCQQSIRARIEHTPIATLIPATLEANVLDYPVSSSTENCTVAAETLLSAWVSAGHPEVQPFNFTDANHVDCQAVFTDILPLFTESNLWYPGALACTACHNSELSPASSAQLNLSSYGEVIAGSLSSSPNGNGEDILGGGNWADSKLNQVLFVNYQMPVGRPANSDSPAGPTLFVGIPAAVANITPTAAPETEEVARPDNAEEPGDAIYLSGDPVQGAVIYVANCQLCHGKEGKGNVLNPGTEDGVVPPLNPIDSTLKDADYQTYAYNLDLFIQNGSHPPGPNPARNMPPWGIQNALTQNQIADVIAYIISLNR
jgi:mono/diheme cytochrome c family protein